MGNPFLCIISLKSPAFRISVILKLCIAFIEIVTFYGHFTFFGSGTLRFLAGTSSDRRLCEMPGKMFNKIAQ